jgi:hypothetical protein
MLIAPLALLLGCVDLAKLPQAFQADGTHAPALERVDQETLREHITRRDGVNAEREAHGCEHLDVAISFRDLKGRPPGTVRLLVERAIKEIDHTPFVPSEPAHKKLRDKLAVARKTLVPSTNMSQPIRFDCGEHALCWIGIGGERGHGFSIFLHHDYDGQ